MKLSQPSRALLEESIKKTVARYRSNGEPNIVTDLHLQPIQGSGEMNIYDDDETNLAGVIIEEWMTYEGDDFYQQTERILVSILTELKQKGELDNLSIMLPFSFVLVDEEKETVAELLLMDDDTLLVNDELLKGLDEELDQFLKELLEK